MGIRETGFLKVLADVSFNEKRVVINPNDGFDLGLMQTEATVLLYIGVSPANADSTDVKPVYARIYLKNECKLGTVELASKSVDQMGKPARVRLHLVDNPEYPKLLISAG